MTKQIKAICILMVIAVTFSIIAFAAPFPFGVTFWTAYISGMLAIALQIPIFKLAFDNAEDYKSKVLGYPVFRVGYIYLTVQMIVSLSLLGLSFLHIPGWISIIVCVLVLAVAIVCSISADIAREQIQSIGQVTKKDTNNIMKLRAISNMLPDKTNDPELKKTLEQLAEDIRFSDPVSNDETASYEDNISFKITELKSAINQNNIKESFELCKSISKLLKERNEICKLSK